MMTKDFIVSACLTVALTAGAALESPAQIESYDPLGAQSQPLIVEALAFAGQSPGQCRLDLFIQVNYEGLSFIKRDDQYDASYEITASLYDSAKTLAGEKLWTEEIKGISFDESVSSAGQRISQRSFAIAPGTYSLTVQVRDLESKTTTRVTRQVLVRDFTASSMAVSDIMLISRTVIQGEKRTITPSVSSNMGTVPDPFYIYFEVYSASPRRDTMRIVATALNEKQEEVLRTDTLRAFPSARNEVMMRIDHTRLLVGDYRLVVALYPARAPEEPQAVAAAARPFSVRWRGLPLSVKNIDVAIDELKYIAKEGEVSTLKDAPTLEEKQKRFFEFWKKRDPNPNTPRNEKMEEYYGRVEYANKHFSHYIEGWRSDMGMVYIMLGTPNNVDRHPFEVDSKPYEVWSYYDTNQSFVFVDETGFGDYRLVTPLWEVWQKPRD